MEFASLAVEAVPTSSSAVIEDLHYVGEIVGEKIHSAIEAYFYSSFGFFITVFVFMLWLDKYNRDKKCQ